MKKITFLLASLFSFLAFANAAVYENLYLIGNATPVTEGNGWTTGNGKITMTKESDGFFTWTGTLKSKDSGDNGNMRFKFIVGNNWAPSVTCQFTTKGHHLVIPGEETILYDHPGTAGTEDNAFQVAETATYEILVNLNTMIMVITKKGEPEPEPDPVPDYNQLYIVGGGTNADGNWDLSQAIAMTKVEEGKFIWTGELYNNTEARQDGNLFKFINTKDWANSINPDNDYEFAVDTDYDLKFKKDDKKFKVTTAGLYTISVNLKEMKVRITAGAFEPKPDLNQLYIVGNATTAGWSPNAALEMTKTAEGVFSWTGSLSTDNGGNQFKFLNVKGSWSSTVVAKDADNNPFVIGTEYDLIYRPYESSPNDFKFTVITNGNYTVNVDLNRMKMKIVDGGSGIVENKYLPFSIEISDGSIKVVSRNNDNIQSVNLFDLSGKKVSGNKLAKGVYILKIKYNDNEYTQKVVLQK